MKQDLSFLGRLPPERHVVSVMVAGNMGDYGGVLAKFTMPHGVTETLFFVSGPAKATYTSLKRTRDIGRLPPISEAENDRLEAAMVPVQEHDWDIQFDQGRVVAVVKSLAAHHGVGFEFVMQDASPRRFWMPTAVARFFGEYIGQYKEAFANHVDQDPEEPVFY